MVFRSKRHYVTFLVPAAVLIVVFLIYPLFRTVFYSFTSWKNFSPKQTWTGLANYSRMINDPVVLVSIRNTLIMMVGVFLFQVGLSLVLAIMVTELKKLFKFFRTVYFFPVLISATAIGLMFKLIYGYEYGLLNLFFGLFGKENRVWINARTSIFLVTIPIMWQYVGFYFVIYLTGMSKIPQEIYESAQMDGITAFQKAIYITLPMLRDVITSVVILVISGCFKVFDLVYVITGGGPLNSSELLSTYMYDTAFRRYNGGYASALAILMICIGVGLTMILRKFLEQKESYQ
nr:sugar ABC transporter permease [uncultured Sphaerochaeta sp.]